MSVTVQLPIITECMELNDTPYFEIFTSTTPATLMYSQQEPIPVNDAVAKMQNALTHMNGRVKILISKRSKEDKKTGGNTANFCYLYNANPNTATTSQVAQNTQALQPANGIFGTQIGATDSVILGLLKEHHKSEISGKEGDLKKDLQIFKLEMEAKQNNAMAMIDRYLPVVLDRIFKIPPAPVAGGAISGVAITPENEAEMQKKLNAAMIKLAGVDGDYINTIDLIADFATKQPAQYEQIKSQLKLQVN